MKKQAATLSIISILFAFIFFGRLLTANASESFQDELIPNPTAVCEFNSNTNRNGEEFYFPDNGKCLNEPISASPAGFENEVPTSIKLLSTGTEIRDPVSTAGILITFMILIALTLFWVGTIRKWNRQSGY